MTCVLLAGLCRSRMDNSGYQADSVKERKETLNRDRSLRQTKNQRNNHFSLQDLGTDHLNHNTK